MTFMKRRVLVLGIPLALEDARLARSLDGVSVLYVSPGLSQPQIERVARTTRRLKVRTMAGLEEYVRWGVALGVVLRDERPRPLVNYEAAKAEGAAFSAQLLGLAEIIGPGPPPPWKGDRSGVPQRAGAATSSSSSR